jgi:hypothetical protein
MISPSMRSALDAVMRQLDDCRDALDMSSLAPAALLIDAAMRIIGDYLEEGAEDADADGLGGARGTQFGSRRDM